jgi:hypothetical protein
VRAQEAYAFFCDLCELQEGDHLEAAWVISVLLFLVHCIGHGMGFKEELTLRYLLTCQSSRLEIPY